MQIYQVTSQAPSSMALPAYPGLEGGGVRVRQQPFDEGELALQHHRQPLLLDAALVAERLLACRVKS